MTETMTPLELAGRLETPGALIDGETLRAAAAALRSYAELVAALEWLQAHLPQRKIGGHPSFVELAKAHGWPGLEEL